MAFTSGWQAVGRETRQPRLRNGPTGRLAAPLAVNSVSLGKPDRAFSPPPTRARPATIWPCRARPGPLTAGAGPEAAPAAWTWPGRPAKDRVGIATCTTWGLAETAFLARRARLAVLRLALLFRRRRLRLGRQ